MSSSRPTTSSPKRERSRGLAAPTDDAVLVRRYRRGDQEALGTIVNRHKAAVYSYVHSKLGSALAADEIALEVFLAFASLVRAGSLDFSPPLQLLRLARQICKSHPGHNSRPTHEEGANLNPLLLLVGDEVDVFFLKEAKALEFSEIAAVLSLRPSAVKLLLQSGIRRLQAEFRGLEEYERSLQGFRAR